VQTRKFWESLTDEELLGVDLVTDDPEGLRDLVREVPVMKRPTSNLNTICESQADKRSSHASTAITSTWLAL
jgi:hypothetical protein